MKCRECGQELDPTAKFCSNCGEKLKVEEGDQDIKIYNPEDEIEEVEDREDDFDMDETIVMEPLSIEDEYEFDYEDEPNLDERQYEEAEALEADKIPWGRIIGLGVLAIFVVLASVFFLKNRTKKAAVKDELISKFITAIEDEDVGAFIRLIEGEDGLIIDKLGSSAFIRYLKEEPASFNSLRQSLKEQSEYYDKNKDDLGNILANVRLRRDGDKFYLTMKPYYLRVNTPLEKVEFSLYGVNDSGGMEGINLGTSDRDNYSEEFGPFVPGIYELGYKLKSDFHELTKVETLVLYEDRPDTGKLVKEVDLSLDVESVKLVSDFEDGNIIINGIMLDKKISDLEDSTLKFLEENMRIQIEVETPFGLFMTEEVAVKDLENRELKVEPDLSNSENKERLMLSMNKFFTDQTSSYNLKENRYTNLIEPELSKRLAEIEDRLSAGDKSEINIHTIAYDLDKLIVKKHDGKYYGLVAYRADYTYGLEDILVTEENETKEGILEERSFKGMAELVYEEETSSWEIFNIERSDHEEGKNIKEFKI